MKNKIIVVDENDRVVGIKDRKNLAKRDIYRVSALWLTNSHGQVLLAKRAKTKLHDPLKWGPAVAGTVENGETYYSNIIKEIDEEIGVSNVTLTKGPKIRRSGKYNHFTQWFFLCFDKDIDEFQIQKDEVEEIKWFPINQLKKKMNDNPQDFLDGIRNQSDELIN